MSEQHWPKRILYGFEQIHLNFALTLLGIIPHPKASKTRYRPSLQRRVWIALLSSYAQKNWLRSQLVHEPHCPKRILYGSERIYLNFALTLLRIIPLQRLQKPDIGHPCDNASGSHCHRPTPIKVDWEVYWCMSCVSLRGFCMPLSGSISI